MTTEELNIEIAKRLGWRARGGGWFDYKNTLESEIDVNFNFVSDANTRPEMLAAMTYEQMQMVCENHCGNPLSDTDCMSILQINQEDFARLWLEVMGKEKV